MPTKIRDFFIGYAIGTVVAVLFVTVIMMKL